MFDCLTWILFKQADEVMKGIKLLRTRASDKAQLLRELYTALAARVSNFANLVFSSLLSLHEVYDSEQGVTIAKKMLGTNLLGVLTKLVTSSSSPEIAVCSLPFLLLFFSRIPIHLAQEPC